MKVRGTGSRNPFVSRKWDRKKNEARMIASVLKQDPNTSKGKKKKKTLFIRTDHNMRIFGVIPFIKPQNDT